MASVSCASALKGCRDRFRIRLHEGGLGALALQDAASLVPDAPPVAKSEPVKTMARPLRGCRLPQYPKRFEEKGEEGTVVFRFLVGVRSVSVSAGAAVAFEFSPAPNPRSQCATARKQGTSASLTCTSFEQIGS